MRRGSAARTRSLVSGGVRVVGRDGMDGRVCGGRAATCGGIAVMQRLSASSSRDVAMVSLEDAPRLSLIEGDITTIAAPVRRLGQKLVESLVTRISCQDGGLRNATANGPITIRPRMMRW